MDIHRLLVSLNHLCAGSKGTELATRIVVYSPQVYENYSLKSGEGLSVLFVVIWLLGDLTNLAGALLADLLPTVVILAVYVSDNGTLVDLWCF